jgi:tRNA(Ile)-lysidine synthase
VATRKQLDWPVIAAAFAKRISHAALHPAAMQFALADWQREKRRRPRAKSPRWALAFSGGADSLALLLIFWAEAEGRWGREFVALHFNHGLRGRAADADEKFCREVCAALGVKFVSAKWRRPGGPHSSDGQTSAKPAIVSEAAARAARHEFFAREMKRRKLRLLWLGHQQDDIAETMLMRLARGSGTGGLAAPRPMQEQADGRVHLRPLLTLKKAEIIAALRASGARWCEDATNTGGEFLRNRVRRSVLPAWARAAGRDALAGAALSRERLEEDDAALETWLDEVAPLRGRVLDLQRLVGKPRALWRRALHRWLLAVRADTDLSRQGFEQLLSAIERGRDTRFSLGARAFAVVRGGKLSLRRA